MISNIQGHSQLPDNVFVAASDIHGMGIFAKTDIPSEHDFGITHVADERFSDGYIRTPFGGFMNHSYEPNCSVYEDGDTLHIKTIKPIAKGEELTLDYRPYYTEEEMRTYK